MTLTQRRNKIKKRIHKLTTYHPRLQSMLEEGLLVIEDEEQQLELCDVACTASQEAWRKWISKRGPDDNGQEHEWIVFANVMKIAEAEVLSTSDRRIATAFSFLHDTCFIKRIMEEEIRKLEKQGKDKDATALREKKKNTRFDHMKGGAKNTKKVLKKLKHPRTLNSPLNKSEFAISYGEGGH